MHADDFHIVHNAIQTIEIKPQSTLQILYYSMCLSACLLIMFIKAGCVMMQDGRNVLTVFAVQWTLYSESIRTP